MIPITFVFSHDKLFNQVHRESSLVSTGKMDSEGNPLFDSLVLDEVNTPYFQSLFFEAQAEVVPAFSRYLYSEKEEIPPLYLPSDFNSNRDFTFCLLLPDDFKKIVIRSIDTKVNEFLLYYILYKWYETKLPVEAQAYGLRAQEALSGAKGLLERRSGPIRRKHRYF